MTWLFLAGAGALIAFWIVLRRRRSQTQSLAGVLNSIAFERIQGLVIPKADEGEIQIDHLILTAQGLLIIDIKDVDGAVFGGDKLQDWTVIGTNSRFTFSNPQPALYDRIAAVRQVVRQVPVSGRIVFLEGATFTKGVPSLVCNLDELHAEFGDQDKSAAKVKIEAFKPHWEQIQALADRASA
ncbi:MAG: nuclease-related domain-containing protein [Woeseiaceae bacterium]